ncbi:class III signal peptide-containing protein [Candidatus Micrarchaeota archaeon]|nr:class III signal peptide-containing protein [Candidatus Micrarchaeota archaeon]MBU2475962.1 class III signal peptide-containing protein [Candidatus Micrarchaeota archaeon]
MDEKAQTSIETLLIIASAVVIAVVVGMFLKSIVTGPIANKTNELAN